MPIHMQWNTYTNNTFHQAKQSTSPAKVESSTHRCVLPSSTSQQQATQLSISATSVTCMHDDDGMMIKTKATTLQMEMARNKPILSRKCMIVLGRAKELAAHRGELLFWATRAHSLNDFCVSCCCSMWKKCSLLFYSFVSSHFGVYL